MRASAVSCSSSAVRSCITRLARGGSFQRLGSSACRFDFGKPGVWRVYTRLDRFDTARRFGPWLFRVGVDLGLDWLRSTKSSPPATASIDRTDADGQAVFELSDPDPRARADLAQEVQYILGLMPASYRTILVLRDLEGFSSSEVAAIVGRREATVRSGDWPAREGSAISGDVVGMGRPGRSGTMIRR